MKNYPVCNELNSSKNFASMGERIGDGADVKSFRADFLGSSHYIN